MTDPSIAGTYRLRRRELPDDTVQEPPLVQGLMTYTREYRNFNIVWKDAAGRFFSECYVAQYALTASEYIETSNYLIIHDGASDTGTRYDLSETTARSTVSIDGARIRFELPQEFERARSIVLEFEDTRLKATSKDEFIDQWTKVA